MNLREKIGYFGFFISILLIAINTANALTFDTSSENYKSSIIGSEESIRLSDGIFERNFDFLRITNENILLKNDKGDVMLIGIGNNKKVDINDDKFQDAEIKYNSFNNGKAEIGLRRLEKLNELKIEEIKEDNRLKEVTYWILGFLLFLIVIYAIKKIKNRKYY